MTLVPVNSPGSFQIGFLHVDHVSEDGRVGRSENVTAGAIADKACPLDHFKCELTGKCVPISAYCNGNLKFLCKWRRNLNHPQLLIFQLALFVVQVSVTAERMT